VFRADWYPAIAAKPYLTFYTMATESGTFEFTWTDDDSGAWRVVRKTSKDQQLAFNVRCLPQLITHHSSPITVFQDISRQT
jgi:hypothetical protein